MVSGVSRKRMGFGLFLSAVTGLTLPPSTTAQTVIQKLSCDVENWQKGPEDDFAIVFADLNLTVEREQLDGKRAVTGNIRFYVEPGNTTDQAPVYTDEITIAGELSGRVISFHDVSKPEDWYFAAVVTYNETTLMAGREVYLHKEGIMDSGMWRGDCVDQLTGLPASPQ